jgi:myo-inositol-1(or 4)-monophosphatase
MSVISPLMTVMIAAARKAGKAVTRDFGEVENLQVAKKGPSDFVTAADLKAEKVIYEELMKARPGYGFLGEERGLEEGTDKTNRWIVDPIDGTTNFIHAIPHFAISIALEREGRLVAGVVFNPITDDLYWAETGKGAFHNDKRMRVAGRKALGDCVLATGIPFQGKPGHGQMFKELHQFTQRVAGIRRFGSAALDLAYVAAGRFDGFWEHDLKLWDIAAGVVLVREAGGKCAEIYDGDFMETGSIVAGNERILALMIERLAAAKG